MQSNEVDLTTEATDLIVHDADIYFDLAHDFSVIRFITSCHKNCMTTRWRVYVTSLTTFMSAMRFLIEIMFTLKAINLILKGHMINRILHSLSFHMKFVKLAKGSFLTFHVN